MNDAPAWVWPHYDYARLIAQFGTPEEKTDCQATLLLLRELLAGFPGGHLMPMEGVKLITHLYDTYAEQIASYRQEVARRQHYRDYQGKIGRSYEEECWTVRAQLAAQICLDLPLGQPQTKEEAREVGNIGGGHEVFVPEAKNLMHHHHIVDPSTRDDIVSWLVVPEGGATYKLSGWIRAGEAKQPQYFKHREREGGPSEAYWVPPAALHSVASWWGIP